MIVFTCILYGILTIVASKKTYYCSQKERGIPHCSYTPGDPRSRILINAPHGGQLLPKKMRKREAGCFIGKKCAWEHECGVKDFVNCGARVLTDYYTGEISKQLVKDIEKLTGIRPYLTVNEVQRQRFDGNRDIRQATFGDPYATKTFHEYHDFIRNATETVKGPVLLVEIHGQGHPAEWIELGYMLKNKDLDEGNLHPQFSSIQGLYLRNKHKFSFSNLITGGKSLGHFLQKEGFKTVPSPAYPGPGNSGYYFGGYNMLKHAPNWNSRVDGVQIELPRHLRNPNKKKKVCKALAKTIISWMKGVGYE